MEKKRPKIARAIDVGYGNTKYVVAHPAKAEIQCAMFPSIAPQATSSDVGAGLMSKRNTVQVEVNGVMYEVGRDAELAKDATHGRVLDESYCTTPTHMALLRGAIAHMGVDHIDLLAVGLPFLTYAKNFKWVMENFAGKHVVPRAGRKETKTVTVDQVVVYPQMLGAWYDHALSSRLYDEMRTQTTLVVDPGYFTLDWLVTKGTKPIDSRSGSHPGSMSAAVGAVADSVSQAIGTKLIDHTPIDEALRLGKNPRFFGREFTDFSNHVKVGKEKARQFVSVLAASVGSGMDIDNIIVTGGGGQFFLDALKEKFPNEINVAKSPIYANVRGFQLGAEQMLRDRESRNV